MSDDDKKQYWLALARAREAMANAYVMEAVACELGEGIFSFSLADNAKHARHMAERNSAMAVNCLAVAATFDSGVKA